MPRPKKKYVLFLVEGWTDSEVLGPWISDLYEDYNPNGEGYIVKFCSMKQDGKNGGDITSAFGVTPQNIEGVINKLFLDPFLEKNSFIYPKEISEIIQIVDLDGAFVPDSAILPMKQVEKGVVYSEDTIYAADVENIKQRNQTKRENLRKLVSMDEIVIRHNNGRNSKKVKYSVYFFSCNMDHFIHKKNNLTQREKISLADGFTANSTLEQFVDVLNEEGAACRDMTYKESWEYIAGGTESLKRHTNLNLLIKKLLEA